ETSEVFRRWLPLMRRARTDLENHNHYIDQMAVGQLRAAILASGRWLVDRGMLHERDDVFWLYHEEITRALRASPPASLVPTVEQRKSTWDSWSRMTPPPILGLPESHLDARPPYRDEMTAETAPESGALQGIGAS